jgi:hypothetical protein
MEFYREGVDAPFHEEDEEVANSYLVWGEVAIHYADLYGTVRQQKDLNGFLLNLVRYISLRNNKRMRISNRKNHPFQINFHGNGQHGCSHHKNHELRPKACECR